MKERLMLSKTDLFEPRLARLALYGKALSHPARLAILEVLAQKQTCICGEIVDELPLAQATVSRHLKALKEAGLIRGEVEGPRSCYCLDVQALQELAEAMHMFLKPFSDIPFNDDSCC